MGDGVPKYPLKDIDTAVNKARGTPGRVLLMVGEAKGGVLRL